MYRRTMGLTALSLALVTGSVLITQPAQAVRDGDAVTDPTPYPAAGWMHAQINYPITGQPALGQTCGVTLVAPQWVLTAQHCLHHDKKAAVTRDTWYHTGDIKVTLGRADRTNSANGGVYAVDKIVKHSDQDYQPLQADAAKPSNDFALLRLKTAVPNAKPALLYDDCGSALPNGTVLNTVGWGDSATGSETKTVTKARRATLTVDGRDPYRLAMRRKTGIAMFGDSGNGLFRMVGGQMVLHGVYHYVGADATKTDVTSWERADQQSKNFGFIKDAVGAGLRTFSDCSVSTPRPGNKLPVAAFTWSRGAGPDNPVTLDGSSSADPDGSITRWSWTSGGTTLGTGRTLATRLGAGASKPMTLTVTDNAGSTGAVTRTLTLPNRAPSISAATPAGGTVPSVTPVLAATAADPDGDSLQYAFTVTGPSVNVSSGWTSSRTWTVPAHRLDPGTAYRWTVTARDPGALTDSRAGAFTTAMLPTASDVVATSTGAGYWQVAADGGVFAYGDAPFRGSLPGLGIRVTNILGLARTPDNGGYWLVGSDGGVFAFGNAPFLGSMAGKGMNAPVVAMSPTRTGRGYWLVGADGGIFAFGDAGFHGSMGGKPLNKPVTAIAPTPSSNGYWLAAQDGGVFAFGDAAFHGSMGGKPLKAPVVDLDVTPDGGGYWMTAEDGGVFAFGNAPFLGSMAGRALNGHIVGMSVRPSGRGYWLTGCDGGIFAFGDAPFYGSNPTYGCRGTS